MTTPKERSRNTIQAGAFLKELRCDPDVPEHVRQEARRLLRHYPSVQDIETIAAFPPQGLLQINYFAGPADPDWWSAYRHGPVVDSDH